VVLSTDLGSLDRLSSETRDRWRTFVGYTDSRPNAKLSGQPLPDRHEDIGIELAEKGQLKQEFTLRSLSLFLPGYSITRTRVAFYTESS
jgi:hypothetical protein